MKRLPLTIFLIPPLATSPIKVYIQKMCKAQFNLKRIASQKH